jgi:mannose-1-phosphate guanylyltransferase
MPDRFVLVLAGGRGERFWPWSRPERPKQLLPLARGSRTLLAATLERARRVARPQNIVVLTARHLKEAVRRELTDPAIRVIGEPVARNTTAAIAAAAARFQSDAHDPAFVVMPADHMIDDVDAFARDLERAFDVAEREPVMLTFGIVPAGPETNFGYIRGGDRVGERLFRVVQFTEKPNRDLARQWVESGEYRWNSGVFVWRCSTFMTALEANRPALATAFHGLSSAGSDEEFEQRLETVFPPLESISVDYAVLEHSPNVLMVEASFDWDDVGSWSSWARRQPRDPQGNVLFGDAVALECERCVVVGEGGTAAAMGLKDMIVVHAAGATLACRMDESEQVRRVSEAASARDER